MNTIRRCMVGSLLLFGVMGMAAVAHLQQRDAATSPVAVDVTKLGPQVGAKVPDFTLTDQNGRSRNLASLMGDKGLVLVFSRSADW